MPTELIGRFGLESRAYERGPHPEFRFYLADRSPRIPVMRDGRLQVVRWGNARRQSRCLPRVGHVWADAIGSGEWSGVATEEVVIAASYFVENGRWFPCRRGIRGLLAPDEKGAAVAFMLCETSTHYYKNMTGSHREPSFVGGLI